MAQLTLSARVREYQGKEAARKLRKNNEIPAIFYGPNTQPIKLSVGLQDLQKVLKQSSSENIILGLQIVSDGGTDTRTVMLKELQSDTVRPIYYHADFYEISMDKELTLNIPIHLVNIPVGIGKGGILEHVKRDLTVTCLPSKLTERIEVDVSSLDIGDSLHVRDVQLPDGIRSEEDADLAIAVVAAPSVVKTEIAEAAEEKEGEEPAGKAAETEATSE